AQLREAAGDHPGRSTAPGTGRARRRAPAARSDAPRRPPRLRNHPGGLAQPAARIPESSAAAAPGTDAFAISAPHPARGNGQDGNSYAGGARAGKWKARETLRSGTEDAARTMHGGRSVLHRAGGKARAANLFFEQAAARIHPATEEEREERAGG